MSKYTYKEILAKAKECKKNVESKYELGISVKWGYYFAKAIQSPKIDIPKITIADAPKPHGTAISRQVSKSDYRSLARKLTDFIESPKNKRMPNYLAYKNHKIVGKTYTYAFARILVFYDKNNRLPDEVNVNSKAFTKPTETGNAVYDYFVKKTGKRFTTIDDLLAYVKVYFKYQKYFDDHKSNKQVIDSKSGNCVDLLQWAINMAKAMGYESKCIHVKCKTSGTGHVFGKFKHPKHTGNTWIIRDIAAVADGGDIRSVWCRDGILQAENPSWFLENLNK